MAAGGWIFSSGFFYPESYERSHMKQILKSLVLKRNIASELQEKYQQGLNPNPCHVRHEGLSCGQFARSEFFLRVVTTSLRLYAPVHLTTWMLAQRHQKMRSKPAITQLKGFTTKLTRSSAYSIGFVYLGWSLCCLLGKLGDHSHLSRKLQFFLSGAISSLAIFAESPGPTIDRANSHVVRARERRECRYTEDPNVPARCEFCPRIIGGWLRGCSGVRDHFRISGEQSSNSTHFAGGRRGARVAKSTQTNKVGLTTG